MSGRSIIAFALGLAWSHSTQAAYSQVGPVYAWGDNTYGESNAGPATAVAAGGGHSLALLKPTGTVLTWGANESGENAVPSGLTSCTSIAAGYWHNLALRANGTVVAWGDNSYGQLNVPVGLSNVKAIASGYLHSLALKTNGTVAAWGENSAGQCSVPFGLSGITAVAAGGFHSFALRSIGTVVVWGDNSVGQCRIPPNLTGVVAIAAGAYHNLALRSNGTVVGWGDDSYGQTDVPMGLNNVIRIAAGGQFSLALRADGTVVGWGDNQYGEIRPPSTLNNAVAISAGAFHALALTSNGEVVGWGENYRGSATTPPGLADYGSISAGQGFNLATTPAGAAVAWGDRSDGKCNVAAVPYTFGRVSAGYRHGLGFVGFKAGSVIAWGDDSLGQTDVPPNVAGQDWNFNQPSTMAAGGYHNLAIVDGIPGPELYAWGDNSYGQSNAPSMVPFAIAAGGYHSLVLTGEATVVAFGRNDSGQCNVPAGLSNVIAIAAGGFHSMALLSNHTVVAWGDNTYGQCNVPLGLTDVVAIAAGGFHSLALKSNGTVVAWGRNDSGQCNVPAGLSGIGAIAAGYNHSLALSAVPRAFNKTIDADANKTLAGGVLANDYNPGTAVELTGTSHGILALESNGSFTYTPDANFTGVDSFTYKDVSAMGESNPATVTLMVYEHLLSCTVAPSILIGGVPSAGKVHLQLPTPAGGRYVHLASDNQAVTVPIYAFVPGGVVDGSFPISTHPVDSTQTVHITAALSTSTAVGTLVVNPPNLGGFTLQQSTIAGGTGTTGVLTLTGKAGPAGVTIALSEDNVAAIIPASVVVATNQNAKSFAISSKGVPQTTIVNISATQGTAHKAAVLTLAPAVLQSLTLTPSAVVGGGGVSGSVSLSGKEGSPVGVVYLQSSSSAAPAPSFVLVIQDQSSGSFNLNTLGVDSTETAIIKGALNGVSKSATVTITPASIAKLVLSSNSVTGGATVSATITIGGLAGPSGIPVTLKSTALSATVAPSVLIAPQTQSVTFTISTKKVSASTSATIVASTNGRGLAYQVLKINP